ncbi:MAG: hypothetical protein AUJ85_01470 [Elusimicrobia bacterium CG1_02_37_114]|nr:MAG: hypothetical protein AUJ85_01470 [Elusimicrobia bacterium CG1_02_37_114]PIV53252.1 MAG: response regulator [Elusimicrobia bacterium CG02_land_8_20_14_3_00_37_13]
MKRILIVDDNELTRSVVRESLESEGYGVIECDNGRKAINLALKEHPDLIVMDIAMPELDGFSTTLELKKNEQTKDIPIIISSAHGSLKEMFAFNEVAAKVFAFIEKPFPLKDLISKVKDVIG